MMGPFMKRPLVLFVSAASLLAGGVLSPREYFGFEPGTDFKLAGYAEISGYFHELDQASDRIRLVEFGRSSEGRPMLVAYISSPANLHQLERYREISRRLALGEALPEEASRLARQGRAIVWIDSGLHATEVAPAQHAPVLAYLLVTGETEELRRIRENVILMQLPVINPDGLEWVVDWYRRNVGTPYELAPLPRLYQKYAGHDNNRDWFMMNLVETRQAARLLFQEWFPQIVYNQHQAPPGPARIFVPPYAEPVNPNIPAAVVEGINWIGAAMRERFAREGKAGVLSYAAFDAWWNGGLRTAPAFHNMHGILTETAAGVYATPRAFKPGDLPARFRHGLPATIPSVFYRPWSGERWGVKEAIEYMLTADLAVLDLAARYRVELLEKAYQPAREAIREGKAGHPYAYVVPATQWDPTAAREMLQRLHWGGIRVERARSEFRANGKVFPAGSFIIRAAQPFRAYLVDLLEPQHYPQLDSRANSPERPYDVAGWTLWMSMGVEVERVEEPFPVDTREVTEFGRQAGVRDLRDLDAYQELAQLLQAGKRVRLAQSRLLVEGEADPGAWEQARLELHSPHVGLYESWVANADTGWTQWLLDTFGIRYRLLHNDDIRKGSLQGLQCIILASQSPAAILHGYREGQATLRDITGLDEKSEQRPEYTGGIGLEGAWQLERYVRDGGTLIALDEATDLILDVFGLPVREASRGGEGPERFQCPGSLVRLTVDTSHELATGMPPQAYAYVYGGRAWDVTLLPRHHQGSRMVAVVARYAEKDLLASGWLSGAGRVQGKAALLQVPHGKGRVILFGFRPQFRGQTFGTFKFLLNALYLSAAQPVPGR